MKHRTPYLTTLIISVASLTGCQTKVIYATPEISGQVFDKQTSQPIEGVNAGINNKASDTTDEQGHFKVPPITYEYTVNAPSHQEVMSRGGASFSISKLGYEIKSYRNGGLAFTVSEDGRKKYVDMGKVYLNPVPVGKEGEYETYYPILDFCKPTESQREVDCIPVPEGKTYAEVSPNQPLN